MAKIKTKSQGTSLITPALLKSIEGMKPPYDYSTAQAIADKASAKTTQTVKKNQRRKIV